MSTLSLSPTTTRKVLAAVVAFLLVSLAIIRTSDAAFTATTSNDGNTWSTGAIELDADHTAPLFGDPAAPTNAVVPAVNLVPGDVVEGCIRITYTGSDDTDALTGVALAVSAIGSEVQDLAQDLTVETAQTADCSVAPSFGAASAFNAWVNSTYADTWTPASDGETQRYHFRVAVGNDAPMNGLVSGVDLTWSIEASS